MSLLQNLTYTSPMRPLFAPYSLVSTVQQLSTNSVPANIVCSTITANSGYVGFGSGNHLSTIGGQLFYNGELLAMASSISSIAEWSYSPALSTVQMDGYDVSGANRVIGQSAEFSSVKGGYIRSADIVDCALLSTIQSEALSADAILGYTSSFIADEALIRSVLNVRSNANISTLNAKEGFVSSLVASEFTVQHFEAISTVSYISSISSTQILAGEVITPFIIASTVSSQNVYANNLFAPTMQVSTLEVENDSVSSLSVSSINGQPPNYVLPMNVTLSTLKVADTLSTANLFAGSLAGTIRLGGFPDTPLTFTSFANTQTHGAALGDYTINALGGDLVLNGSNDILVNSSNDFTVTAGDINLTQTDATSVFNITTTGAALMAFGLALDITTTSYLAINSGGNVSIGSANILGADTEIEKVGFKENQIYKAGSNDLEIADVSSINGYKYIPTQLWASTVASQNVNMNTYSLSNASTLGAKTVSTLELITSSVVATNDMNFNVGGSINTNGSVVNLTGSEIHNASLMHSRNNSNLVIETKGSGALILSSLSTVATSYFMANSASISTLNLSTLSIVGNEQISKQSGLLSNSYGTNIDNLILTSPFAQYSSATTSLLFQGLESSNVLAKIAGLDAATSGTYKGNLVFQIGSNTFLNEAMRVVESGYVGIGTSSPAIRLHVQSLAQTVSSCATMRSGGVDMCLGFIGGGENSGAIQVFSGGSGSNFGTTGYVLRLQPHGGVLQVGNCNVTPTLWVSTTRVGVNTNTPTAALDVAGAIQGSSYISTVSSIQSIVNTSTLATNTISTQQVNVSTVSARAVTATALNYPAVAVTGSANSTFTFTDVHTYVYNTYNGGGNATWTLPTASSYQGRVLFVKNNAAATGVISASANVIPQGGGGAGTALLAAGATKWAIVISDGSNWIVMASN